MKTNPLSKLTGKTNHTVNFPLLSALLWHQHLPMTAVNSAQIRVRVRKGILDCLWSVDPSLIEAREGRACEVTKRIVIFCRTFSRLLSALSYPEPAVYEGDRKERGVEAEVDCPGELQALLNIEASSDRTVGNRTKMERRLETRLSQGLIWDIRK
jgi:hypothetical protein